ncbi:MAG: hypothetical protein NC098_09390 [Lachnoclostridium sp.]|nr:hypothetical protein [Lachnoclostridium sp.]
MNETEIRRAFCSEELRQYIALSYDFDIAPMLADGCAQFSTFTGDTLIEAVSKLVDSELFDSAKAVVFNIVTGPEADLKMSDFKPLNDFLSTLRDDLEVIWGFAANPTQSSNVMINVLIRHQG